MAGPTPDRTGLRRLYPHTTLVQSFDTARFHEDRFEEDERINLARTETFLNLLYGREIVIPAGQIAESPAVSALFREVMSAYKAHRKNIPEFARWRPFRIALEPEFRDYKDYVGKYEDIGAPMAMLPLDEQQKAQERDLALSHLKQLFLDGKYRELAKLIRRDEYEEYAELVADYFLEPTAIRPMRSGVPQGTADFVNTFRNRLGQVPEEKRDADALPEIESVIPYFEEQRSGSGFRGVWYANRERFGDSWELARVWLDQALYFTLAERYGVEHPVYVTQDLERGRFDPQVVLGFNTPEDGELVRPELPNEVARLPKLSWDVVWDVLADEGFHRRVDRLTAKINRAEWDRELDDAVWEHTEFLNESFSDIAFDLRNGCFVLDVKKKPGRLKSLIAGGLAGGVAAGAVPLLANSFLPGAGLAVTFFQGAASTIAAGLTNRLVTTESQWFYRRRKRKLESSNKEILRDAMEVVNFWTKPVLNAGEIARARSAKLMEADGE